MHDDEVKIDRHLVRDLLVAQMPGLSRLPLTMVEPWGTDNAIWRLGDDLVVRLPRIGWAADQVDLEAQWLPRLAPHLPFSVPEPVAVGLPSAAYPYRWAIHRWIDGVGAATEAMDDPIAFARNLARFVADLHSIDPTGGPDARNRALPLADYDQSARQAIQSARHLIDADQALAVWDEALAANPHPGPPVWVHGDLEGNCLLRYGQLCGIIDWGCACVGDPAVDVQVVWSPLFTEQSRQTFLEALDVDDATIARSRGAAIQQACGALPYYLDSYPLIVERSWHKLRSLGVGLRPSRR